MRIHTRGQFEGRAGRRWCSWCVWMWPAIVMTGMMGASVWAQEAPASKPPSLSEDQDAIRLRYRKFAQVLQEMTEYLRQAEPDRAALLSQVSRKSNEAQVVEKMDRLIELLEKGKLGEAIEEEGELLASLQGILDMLNSEDRAKELAEEKARIEANLKEVNQLIGKQRDVRSATERGKNPEELAPQQEKLEKQAGELQQKLGSQGKKSGAGKPDGGKPEEGKPEENPAESKEPQNPREEETPGEEQKPLENSGKPSEGGESSQNSPPGAEELKQAQQAMQDAFEKLKKNQGRGASEQQDQAIKELEKAKQKLEEILRQLREEERDRALVGLEERLQRLLAGEQAIYTETVQVAEVPVAQRNSRHRNKGIQLSRQQSELRLETEKLLRLLRDEGSAVAFPEVVTQVRDDMQGISGRLEKGEFGDFTQSMESDVIASLKEMILALQKEMEENRQKKMKGNPQQQGSPQDPDLVQQLAELKILRSLQMRINTRTKQIGKLVTRDQADDAELVEQLQKLSDAQLRVQRAAYDLATKKNE